MASVNRPSVSNARGAAIAAAPGSVESDGQSRTADPKTVHAFGHRPGVAAVSNRQGIEIAFPTDFERDFGAAVWLVMKGDTENRWGSRDLSRLIEPPVRLAQCLIFRKNETPFGFASWATLTKEAEDGFVKRTRKLGPGDWNAGERLWIIDAVFPFGGLSIINRLRSTFFRDKSGKFMREQRDGTWRVYEWHGMDINGATNTWWRAPR